MKKTFVVGQYAKLNTFTQQKALCNLIIELSDIAVGDWKNEKNILTGKPLNKARTVKEILASGHANHVTFFHPVSQQSYTLDLSPWASVDGNRYLRIDIGWVHL